MRISELRRTWRKKHVRAAQALGPRGVDIVRRPPRSGWLRRLRIGQRRGAKGDDEGRQEEMVQPVDEARRRSRRPETAARRARAAAPAARRARRPASTSAATKSGLDHEIDEAAAFAPPTAGRQRQRHEDRQHRGLGRPARGSARAGRDHQRDRPCVARSDWPKLTRSAHRRGKSDIAAKAAGRGRAAWSGPRYRPAVPRAPSIKVAGIARQHAQ